MEKRKPSVEIVSHCYAAELPQYAAMLVYQASSLVLHKPKLCDVRLTVCVLGKEGEEHHLPWTLADPNLERVLPWMKKILLEHGVQWAVCYLSREQIGRRCIGRNRAAKSSDADFVWFADVDQVFRDGVLDRLVEMEWPDGASMIYPREIIIHRDWKLGDERTGLVDLQNPMLVDIDSKDFVDKPYRKAIGGVQIVRGDFAREHGYLDGQEKWMQPTEKPFGNFRDDLAYRRFCEGYGPIVGVDLPGMFRLRHTRTTYQADKA